MKRPRIALVSPGSFIIPSDRASSVEHVMKELAGQLAQHCDCTIYGIREKGMKAAEYRDQVRYLRPSGRKQYRAAVIRSLKREHYDLIQVDNRPRMARAVQRAMPRARVWLALHSLTFVLPRRISRRELEDCLSRVERITVNSRYVQEELSRLAPSAAGKIHVIYPGVDTGCFASRWSPEGSLLREERLAQLGYSNRKIILYVGRLVQIKGVHHLLRAMERVAAIDPEALLLVVGGAFYGSKRTTPYVRSLHRMGGRLRRNVVFISYVPHDRIAEWFRLADVAVVPSPRREAFGLVNVEAMASGVPVVAAQAGGMTEIVVHGATGLLVPTEQLADGLAEALVYLLGSPDQIRIMGAQAEERVREVFTWENAARSWLELAGWAATIG